MQQQFPTMTGIAPEVGTAADELGIAALLNSVAEILRSFGGAESLAYSVDEWSDTIRSAAVKRIREYVIKSLMQQRVFDPAGMPYCATCRLAPCACSIGAR